MRALKWRWCDAIARSDLTSTERAIAQAHGRYADEDGSRVYPGVAAITRDTAFNRKTVEKARSKLVSTGWLAVVMKGGAPKDGHRMKSEFRLHIPAQFTGVEDDWSDYVDDDWTTRSGRVVDDRPPADVPRPPAQDSTTTRSGEALLTTDQPATNHTRPPAQDGWSAGSTFIPGTGWVTEAEPVERRAS